MADVKISALPLASTPLAGTEVLPIVQSATTDQVSVANLTAGRSVSAASLTLTTTPLAVGSGGTGITAFGTGVATALGVNTNAANGLAVLNSSGALNVGQGGTGLTSLTAGYIPYGNGTGAFGNSANFTYDGSKVLVSGNSAAAPTALSGTGLQIVAADTATARLGMDAFAAGCQLIYRRANGTNASPSALQADQLIGNFAAFGYGATAYSSGNRASISISASENWTDSAQGTYITFGTTVSGTASPSEKMRIASDGAVGIGYTTTSGIGANGLAVSGNLLVGNTGQLISERARFTQNISSGTTGYIVIDSTAASYTASLLLGVFNDTTTTKGFVGTYSNNSLSFRTNNTERAIIDTSGNVVINTAAIATTATDGFLYVPTCAGTPTGTPTTYTGRAPIVVNTTNNKLYFYSGGAWRDAGP